MCSEVLFTLWLPLQVRGCRCSPWLHWRRFCAGGERDEGLQLHDQSPQTSSGWWHHTPAAAHDRPTSKEHCTSVSHFVWMRAWHMRLIPLLVCEPAQAGTKTTTKPQMKCKELIYFFTSPIRGSLKQMLQSWKTLHRQLVFF